MSEMRRGGNRRKHFGGKAEIFLLILIVGQLFFIFSNSHRNADESTVQSSHFVRFYIERLEGMRYEEAPLSHIDAVTHYVRKTAHFTEYFVLGFLAAAYLWVSGRTRFVPIAAVSFAFAFIIACMDEFSQSFSPGRSNQFSDVLIDTAGGICGGMALLLAAAVIIRLKQYHNRKTRGEHEHI